MAKQTFGIMAQCVADPLGFGQSTRGLFYGEVPAIHKWNTETSPYCVPNEFICGTLGTYLGLPIPPFAITVPPQGMAAKHMFSSLNFNFEGRDLRPVIPANCVASLAKLCTGIFLFDVLIANSDRHDSNLAVDRMDVPREMQVFDHECALFGANLGSHPHGIERLKKLRDRLGVSGGAVTGNNTHLFLREFLDTTHFREWINIIKNLQISFIKRTCQRSRRFGLTKEEAVEAESFLVHRKDNLEGIVTKHKKEFSAIKKWVTI
jgi:hypothetical protein